MSVDFVKLISPHSPPEMGFPLIYVVEGFDVAPSNLLS